MLWFCRAGVQREEPKSLMKRPGTISERRAAEGEGTWAYRC